MSEQIDTVAERRSEKVARRRERDLADVPRRAVLERRGWRARSGDRRVEECQPAPQRTDGEISLRVDADRDDGTRRDREVWRRARADRKGVLLDSSRRLVVADV